MVRRLGFSSAGASIFTPANSGVDHDAAAVFADDNLLAHADIELTLGRNLVEATTAGITLHIDDAQTVARTLADAFESREQARFDVRFERLRFSRSFSSSAFVSDTISSSSVRFKSRSC